MAKTNEPVFRRPGGDVFYAWVPDPRTGKAVRKSTGCYTQADAIAWRRRHLRAEQDPAGTAARTVTLEGVLNDFLESRSQRTKANGKPLAADTLEFYQAKASMVADVLGASTLASKITAEAIDAYVKARRGDMTSRGERVTDHTISKELAVLRAALARAKRLGKWRGDLAAVFPSSRDFSPGYDPRKSGAKALSREDVGKILATIPPEPPADAKPHVREGYRRAMGRLALVAYGIACGAELAALARARRQDLSWNEDDPGRSVVHVRGTKNEHRDRMVPIATLEQAYLITFAFKYAPGLGDLLFPSLGNIRRDMHAIADRAGVRRFSPHVLRHTLAKWLRAGGVDSATTGAMLGHADGRMVERVYGRLDRAEDVRSSVAAQYRPARVAASSEGAPPVYGNDGKARPAGAAAPDQNRGAEAPQGELSVYGNGGGSGVPRHPWRDEPEGAAAIFSGDPVPRDGIEPPTRGFSGQQGILLIPGKAKGNKGSFKPRAAPVPQEPTEPVQIKPRPPLKRTKCAPMRTLEEQERAWKASDAYRLRNARFRDFGPPAPDAPRPQVEGAMGIRPARVGRFADGRTEGAKGGE